MCYTTQQGTIIYIQDQFGIAFQDHIAQTGGIGMADIAIVADQGFHVL
jgi:hypothetical protein